MNVDLSGGEAKRNETLQLAIIRPRSPSSTSSTRALTSTRSVRCQGASSGPQEKAILPWA